MILYILEKILNKNVSSIEPNPGEKMILQEDCSEDNLKNGFLSLTNQRLLFEKTIGTLATLSKKTGDLLLNISLDKIDSVYSEGILLKKIVVKLNDNSVYKFSVFSTKKWVKLIKEQKSLYLQK